MTSSFWRRPFSPSHSSWCRRPSTAILPALGEVFGADLGLAAEADDVDEVRAAVLAVLVAAARHREAQLGDLRVAALAQLDVLGEPADQVHYLELGVGGSIMCLVFAWVVVVGRAC